MPLTLADTPMTSPSDTTPSALEHVHRLLVAPAAEQSGFEEMLAHLAAAFQAPAAGLASLSDDSPCFRFPACEDDGPPLPWQDDPSLLDGPGPVPGAVSLDRVGGGSLLATLMQTSDSVRWVLWLEDSGRTSWTDGESGALFLAGAAIARRLNADSLPRWAEQLDRIARQQRLETAAAVTRRLAHDFGNVLTGILGFTELALAQQVPANTPLHTYLQEVYRAAQAGAQLTSHLRLFSRRQSATSRSCPLPVVLAEQEARLFSAREAGVNLRLNVPTDLPAVALDSEQLTYVLTALLDNAREALLGPGSISVSARLSEMSEADCRDLFGSAQPGPHVEITIADTGIGLSPDAQRRLFSEPFFTTKPRRRGFGLSTAYGILHAHRGGIRLHPGAEHGVVARVLLPVAPSCHSEAEPASAGNGARETARGERILVVDDEPEVLRFVASSLERAGYRVESAPSGEAAFDRISAQGGDPYRLVLTDVIMPGIGGVGLVNRILKRDPAARVLFMSGHVSSDFTQQDFASYRFELLTKPFRADHLLRAVRAALDRPARPVGASASQTRK
jgi:signal transduction histidine kinase/ActR/RegA family two-component response regulator